MKKLVLSFISVSVLFTAVKAQFAGQGKVTSAGGNLNQYLNRTILEGVKPNAKAGAINAFNNEENTRGTRFLFDTWVNGDSVTNTQGNYINTESFLFNFDKLSGNVLVTQDKINIMSVAPDGINSFILKDNDKPYIFEHVNKIDPSGFFLELVKSESGYSLYKMFKTKFTEANFKSDGVVQTGIQENEYKDESRYYIIGTGAAAAKLINFKPKVIKAALEEKKDKTDAYFKQHKNDAVDENFLTGLIIFLNN
jgi:hypothetical protein